MSNECLFFRLLKEEDKAARLAGLVGSVQKGDVTPATFAVAPASFSQIPGSPFAYWSPDSIRLLFTNLEQLENSYGIVRVGLQTDDDFRFVRSSWEVAPESIGWSISDTFDGKGWISLLKGDRASPFYSEISTLVNWFEDGSSVKAWISVALGGGHWSRHAFNTDLYCCPGLSWALRTSMFHPSVVPQGCISTVSRYLLAPSGEPFELMALLNSTIVSFMLRMTSERYEHPKFIVGIVQRLPMPKSFSPFSSELAQLGKSSYLSSRQENAFEETSRYFVLPGLLWFQNPGLSARVQEWQANLAACESQLAKNLARIDDIAFALYAIGDSDRKQVLESITNNSVSSSAEESGDDDSSQNGPDGATSGLLAVQSFFSYLVGGILGRFDARFATGEKPVPDLPDPFAPLPACSPGMLKGEDGLPAMEAPAGYPLAIDWDGILVDDAAHSDDILRRVRDALEVIFKERAEAIEREACEILGVQELRDYFRRPGNGGFWMDHVRRYSKSRRKAPIYWLLQSSKKNYALWLYYHRLDKDMLFKALVNYVEPKLRLEENRLQEVMAKKAGAGASGREAKWLEKEIDQQDAFLTELRDFHDKLRRVADLHLEPDLNDGVILNIAPLWELVPWKEPKAYWEDLLAGKYEWSSIGKQLRERGKVAKND